MTAETDFTSAIRALVDDKARGTRELLPLVYEELRSIAVEKLAHERNDHTLQPTALVHEAYIRLQNVATVSWENRAHFFGAAAEAMRRILVDHARGKQRLKRGGDFSRRGDCSLLDEVRNEPADELIALDDALAALTDIEPSKAELVKLKFFGGLSTHEAAELLGISSRTAERHWAFARAWLYREMSEEE